MKRIVYFMIVEVEFSDGTKYDATKVFNAFKEHISGLSPVYNTRYKF
jgi:hypothetical protein